MKYSKEYEVPITTAQADQIVVLMKGKNINIYDNDERLELLKQIAKVTSPATAQQVNTLFQQLLK
ncbi:tRNA methyltransferase [Bacillus cereus]|nr:tRNA methyltransferase [Bacillus cereus]BCC48849.1 tRNA methyltransferase [Bacillus cereus]BCC95818.1 tRNA methyltransferase [Bacillus cereus]BCD07192.1 tRNA methyltransferase [Bacillus cereus]BCD19479.1 tRNA methyltransferase [Bacillus cereus]